MWFLNKGGGVLTQGGVTRFSAQNRDWPFPEWDSAGGGKAAPALQLLTTGASCTPAGKWEAGAKFRAPVALTRRGGAGGMGVVVTEQTVGQ